MQLRHVRYFVATADAGSVSSAAARVHVTQPALSRQLRQLEQDLGVTLFDRGAGRLTLNRTGRALLPRARDLLAAAEALHDDATFHSEGGLRRLTISAPTVTLTDVVSPFVATMTPADPVVDVRSADGLSVAAMLEQGADLAIGTHRPQLPFDYFELAVLPVWAYVPRTDVWASRRRVLLSELLERLVIGLPGTFTAREALDAAVAASDGAYSHILEAANGTIAQALAAAGRGVAVVSDDPRFDLVPLEIEAAASLVDIRLIAAWDARSIAAAQLAAIGERLRAWIAGHYHLS